MVYISQCCPMLFSLCIIQSFMTAHITLKPPWLWRLTYLAPTILIYSLRALVMRQMQQVVGIYPLIPIILRMGNGMGIPVVTFMVVSVL
jgi:hypothetical protein